MLTMGQFDWHSYGKLHDDGEELQTVSQLVPQFKVAYLRSHKLKETTWRETWQRTYDRLPQDEPLTEGAVLAVVLGTEPHPRTRELTCQRLQKLVDFAGMKMDLSGYEGEYSPKSLKPRDLPSKELIEEWWEKIPNLSWRWVYGMLATFGLRPHEAFFCEFIDSYAIQVNDGKTGNRVSRAAVPEWVKQWDLETINQPDVKGNAFRDYGQRVSRQFNRYQNPFQPYDLRHAYAVWMSVVIKLPVSIVAGMMGHSVTVHTQTYHR